MAPSEPAADNAASRPPNWPPKWSAHRPAIFLDRDDTLNVNADLPDDAFPGKFGDLFLPDRVEVFEGVVEACRAIKAANYLVIVVTNQGGVARGACDMRAVEATNDRLRELILPEDADAPPDLPAVLGPTLIDAVYVAPHHPGDETTVDYLREDHPWRKPGPGMILAAAADHNVDLSRSWLIGDKQRDCESGVNAGIDASRCLWIGEGDDRDFPDMPSATQWLLSFGPPAAESPAPPTPIAPPPQRVYPVLSVVRLRASSKSPLADDRVRGMVASTARAIAERTGIELVSLDLDETSVEARVATHRLAAIGFAAELRRVTNAWHAGRSKGELLWPVREIDPRDPDDPDRGPEDWRDAGDGA